MIEANALYPEDVASRWHHLDTALPALVHARHKLEEAGYEDVAETVAEVHSEMACERDTAERLLTAGEMEEDGCEVCGAFSHDSRECTDFDSEGR